jgi:hypothetical protein
MRIPRFKPRVWHNWLSVLLLVPIFLVGATAILIAHEKRLGLDAVTLDAAWLPGYAGQAMKQERLELRAALVTRAGVQYLGTKGGLYRLGKGVAEPVAELVGIEVRALAENAGMLYAGTKAGIYRLAGEGWQRVQPGDVHGLTAGIDGRLQAALKDEGLLTSDDGRTWRVEPTVAKAMAVLAQETRSEPLTLKKLNMDLHTGKALLGKHAEWLWIDLVGGAILFLSLTGVYLWWRGRRLAG